MSLRRKLEERIRRKEAEIAELHVQIRTAEAYLQSLNDTLRMLSREEPSTGNGTPAIREGGMVAAAMNALRERGKPMHITEILAAIGRPNTRDKRAALGGSLAAYVRRGQVFTRPKPAVFGLVEFTDSDADYGGSDANAEETE
jgi:hypothetical protein